MDAPLLEEPSRARVTAKEKRARAARATEKEEKKLEIATIVLKRGILLGIAGQRRRPKVVEKVQMR